MPAPEMTTELKNDLKLLRMRNALDPSQHYKASDWKKLPRYFQVIIYNVQYGVHKLLVLQWKL